MKNVNSLHAVVSDEFPPPVANGDEPAGEVLAPIDVVERDFVDAFTPEEKQFLDQYCRDDDGASENLDKWISELMGGLECQVPILFCSS